jgi:hypothetical protein
MSKQNLHLLWLFCLALWLSSCQNAPKSLAATLTPPLPSAVPTFRSTATARLPGAGTDVPVPSVTPSQAATASAAASPTAASPQAPIPTVDATATAIVQSLVAAVQPRLLKAFPSPDGKWRAEVSTYPCTKIVPGETQENAFDILRLTRLKDRQAFSAWSQLQFCGGLGAFGLGGIKWSPDGRFFYFTDAREGVPDGGGFYGWYKNVFRFDTSTVQTEYLGAGPFSPDGKWIAVVRTELQGGCHPGGLAVLDLNGQVLAEYPFDVPAEACGFSYLSWSPDGQALAYTLAICSSSGTDCRSALYQVDLRNGHGARQVLLENQPAQFVNIAWNTADRLELWSSDGHWLYVRSTGKLELQP